ncbi:hypothetical protein CC86DRAFT_286036 [Ophiobolus disseminans]|uniref:Sequence orphan n=1 Tax=Ophiobolus disseminans TaxID=1469910 RepID=A0A6A7AAA1_9PLEO|nr:hypothetical protein CC86DRAFT_286036 [Ophiobolus disseminans]
MTQHLQSNRFDEAWKGSKLPATLAGDIAAAGISASLISPLITAIDRAVVENAASTRHPLLSTLKSHVICSFRHPRLFFAAKPFFYVWTLYAATYATANSVESAAKAVTSKADQVLVSSITFLSTCIVNVPLGVWKDVRFVQLYGRPNAQPPSRPVKVPRIVGATFLFRDAITIFGSINLPPMLSPLLSDSYFASPAIKMAALQLSVPILSQVVATPVHLLALDLYNNQQKEGSASRISRMKRSLVPTTAMRCSRIIPAFGVGLVVNTGLRDYFHGLVGSVAQK